MGQSINYYGDDKGHGFGRGAFMEEIKTNLAVLAEGMRHVVEKVDKIDTRTADLNEKTIRHEMTVQSMHQRMDGLERNIGQNRIDIDRHEDLIQQAKGFEIFGMKIGGVIAWLISIAAAAWAFLKG